MANVQGHQTNPRRTSSSQTVTNHRQNSRTNRHFVRCNTANALVHACRHVARNMRIVAFWRVHSQTHHQIHSEAQPPHLSFERQQCHRPARYYERNTIVHVVATRSIEDRSFPTRHVCCDQQRKAIQYMLAYLRKRQCSLARQPLLIGDDGQALSTSALVKFTQSLIEKASIANAHLFLGHSFRKGGATSLHEAGHPDSLIKLMGRWASFAFATYIDTPLHMLIEAGQSMTKVDPINGSFWDVNSLF